MLTITSAPHRVARLLLASSVILILVAGGLPVAATAGGERAGDLSCRCPTTTTTRPTTTTTQPTTTTTQPTTTTTQPTTTTTQPTTTTTDVEVKGTIVEADDELPFTGIPVSSLLGVAATLAAGGLTLLRLTARNGTG